MKNILILLLCALTAISCKEVSSQQQSLALNETALDTDLRSLIRQENLQPLSEASFNSRLVELGRLLFEEKDLSGHQDISCQSCHDPNQGTSDGLPFSFGTLNLGTTARHAPSLFNLVDRVSFAFHDGRVSFTNGVIETPSDDLNNATEEVVSAFETVWDVQPLFPLINEVEMRGTGNELDGLSDTAVWEYLINERLLTKSFYKNEFEALFPSEKIGASHLGHALGTFMQAEFLIHDTPFDQFIAGNSNAMTLPQKRGMRLFFGRAQCFQCHSGTLLSNGRFEGVGVPEFSVTPFEDDLGRADVTNQRSDLYHFKTPGLRNVSQSAPYMHNGAFKTLREVVDHYSNIANSLNRYQIPQDYQEIYSNNLVLDEDQNRNQIRLDQVSNNRLRRGLRLTSQEKEDLLDFLENALKGQ